MKRHRRLVRRLLAKTARLREQLRDAHDKALASESIAPLRVPHPRDAAHGSGSAFTGSSSLQTWTRQ